MTAAKSGLMAISVPYRQNLYIPVPNLGAGYTHTRIYAVALCFYSAWVVYHERVVQELPPMTAIRP